MFPFLTITPKIKLFHINAFPLMSIRNVLNWFGNRGCCWIETPGGLAEPKSRASGELTALRADHYFSGGSSILMYTPNTRKDTINWPKLNICHRLIPCDQCKCYVCV